MALAQNPSIAAISNLVLYYDAANVKSYPGAGTTSMICLAMETMEH